MKHTIELDVKDIQQLIAKEFDVKEEQVVVAIKKYIVGMELESIRIIKSMLR